MMKLIPVIMSGGADCRAFWPLSRELSADPFIPLPGGGTLIRKWNATRCRTCGRRYVVTVTNRELLFLTANEYPEAPVKGVANTFILEPFRPRHGGSHREAALQVARA